MATRRSDSSTRTAGPAYIEVAGFKSISPDAPARLHLRGLTLLAGANSSGKSAIMQPLLLMKQTMEASYDPGPLLLDGPHVEFTAVEQFLWRGPRSTAEALTIELGAMSGWWRQDGETPARLVFLRTTEADGAMVLAPACAEVLVRDGWVRIDKALTAEQVVALALRGNDETRRALWPLDDIRRVDVERSRLDFSIAINGPVTDFWLSPLGGAVNWLATLLHLPGLRGHRDRLYRVARVRLLDAFLRVDGPFTPYVASLLHDWQVPHSSEDVGYVTRSLQRMGLTSHVSARRPNATHLEVKVGRTLDAAPHDLVDIADVGFGVSQVLPVVVALAAAAPGQPVYIEQPELHLHPRAQFVMGQLLVEAVDRGVDVIVETHSRMILRAIQTAVARKAIAPEDVGLHWFSRDPETGATRVDLAELDADGAFGEWPVDFSEAEAEADDAWLEAVLDRQS